MTDTGFSALKLFRVDDDVAVVTGGASGLGRIAALTLAEAGAHVCVTDIDHNKAGETVAEIEAAGGKADTWLLDVMDNDAICHVIAEIAAKHGRIDILVNNAGSAQRDPTETMPTEVWDRIIQMNQTQLFICSREVGKHMLAQNKGAIINLASIMGLAGGGLYGNLPYHATKGAVVNMTRALASEWASRGIRVNAIAPTFTKTDLTKQLLEKPELVAQIEERTPMGRVAEPEEMAGAILYLASPASSMVTGHTLPVDGGWLAI
ncbi:MAG: glucose 1-dehydrogenase [Alphaproteobacteria bacterium]|nr:glucose 1-dehydrogenase [Alphaproteobacteria bacterium]